MSDILEQQQVDYLRSYLHVDSFKNAADFNEHLYSSFFYTYKMVLIGRTDKVHPEAWDILVALITHFSSNIPVFGYHERCQTGAVEITKELQQSVFDSIAAYLTSLYFQNEDPRKKSFLQKLKSFFN